MQIVAARGGVYVDDHAGRVAVFVWKYGVAPMGGVLAVYELLPAFVIGLVVLVVVSLLTKAPSEEIVKEYEAMEASLKKR